MNKKIFNLNKTISVKLYDKGFKWLTDNYNEYSPPEKTYTIEHFKERCDENGYFSMQMWEFIDIFGELCHMGAPTDSYFSMDLLIDERDLSPLKSLIPTNEDKCPRIVEEAFFMESMDKGRRILIDTHKRSKSLIFTGFNRNDIISFLNGEIPNYIPSFKCETSFPISLNEEYVVICLNMRIVEEFGQFFIRDDINQSKVI